MMESEIRQNNQESANSFGLSKEKADILAILMDDNRKNGYGIDETREAVLMPENGVICAATGHDPALSCFLDNVRSIEWAGQEVPEGVQAYAVQDIGVPVYAWIDGDVMNFASVADKVYLNPDSEHMFSSMKNLQMVPGLAHLDAFKCTDLSHAFFQCESLEDLSGIAGWNVSNVERMNHTFSGCSSLDDLTPLKGWNVSSCELMCGTFCDCEALTNLNGLEKWNSGKRVNRRYMFSRCSSLKDVSAAKSWKIRNANTLNDVFFCCHNADMKSLAPRKHSRGM